jgi:hypothetical protein
MLTSKVRAAAVDPPPCEFKGKPVTPSRAVRGAEGVNVNTLLLASAVTVPSTMNLLLKTVVRLPKAVLLVNVGAT